MKGGFRMSGGCTLHRGGATVLEKGCSPGLAARESLLLQEGQVQATVCGMGGLEGQQA